MGKAIAKTIPHEWHDDVPRSTRAPTLGGLMLVALAVLGFGYWANAAPISGAVITSGSFVATGQNKIVQHFEGGIIEEILVREGERVEAGQVLVRLDRTAPRANLRRLRLRMARLDAMEARLRAEMSDAKEITLPPSLVARRDDPEIAPILESQTLTFEARRANVYGEIAVLEREIASLEKRIGGSERQLEAAREQIGYFEEEIASKAALLKSGLIRRPEYLSLRRARADLTGDAAQVEAQMGDAKERIERARKEIVRARAKAVQRAVEEMEEVGGQRDDIREQIGAAQDVLDRVEIAAPVDGVVVALRYHTPGGVIEGGKDIMEILPLEEELLIEARVRPQDIDAVKTGQEASVRLTALSRRVTPTVTGVVTYISADALPNDRPDAISPGDVYVARVRLDPEEARAIPGFDPTPGMPAEVYIKTAERTFFEYLMQPVKDSMARAFREG